MVISDFFILFDFDPKNFEFSKIIAYKIRNFQNFQKTEYMLSRYIQTTHIQNFKTIFFGCAMAKKKQVKGDDVTFLKSIFWHF